MKIFKKLGVRVFSTAATQKVYSCYWGSVYKNRLIQRSTILLKNTPICWEHVSPPHVRAESDSSALTGTRARPTAETGAPQLNCQLPNSPYEPGLLLAVAGQTYVLTETVNLWKVSLYARIRKQKLKSVAHGAFFCTFCRCHDYIAKLFL